MSDGDGYVPPALYYIDWIVVLPDCTCRCPWLGFAQVATASLLDVFKNLFIFCIINCS